MDARASSPEASSRHAKVQVRPRLMRIREAVAAFPRARRRSDAVDMVGAATGWRSRRTNRVFGSRLLIRARRPPMSPHVSNANLETSNETVDFVQTISIAGADEQDGCDPKIDFADVEGRIDADVRVLSAGPLLHAWTGAEMACEPQTSALG